MAGRPASDRRWRGCKVEVVSQPVRGVDGGPLAALLRPGLLRLAGIGVALAVFAVLAGYNLGRYPTTWFDEGSHLHVPKALVQHGVYADTSSEGFRYFGPTTGVGPTVLLPIAAVFKVAGIGLVQARVVILIYLLVAIVAFAAVARHLHGGVTAVLAVALLVTSPGINLWYLGRQVLGEVPALAFLMLGVLAWAQQAGTGAVDRRRLLVASACFGLAALTKNQFTLILAPTFVLLFIADRLYYRQLSILQTLLPFLFVGGGAVAGQLAPLLPLLGTDEFDRTLALARQASAGAIFVFLPDRIASSLRFLFSADALAFWAIPGLLYGLAYARRDVPGAVRNALLLIFAACGLGWFAFGSIGWTRYAFPGLAVAAIFAGRLIEDLVRVVAARGGDARSSLRAAALILAVVLALGAGLLQSARAIVATRDESPQQLAAYLTATLPAATVIETWEPEIGFLADHAFHYPPSGWLDRAVRAKWLGGSAELDYDPLRESDASYLLVGRFGKYSGIYAPFLEKARPELIRSVGEYDLYRVQRQR